MTSDYSEADILPRFTYPKWIWGTSIVVLVCFGYALVGLRETTDQIALKQKAITAFEAQQYEKCLEWINQLPMNGSLAYYKAGSLYGLRDTARFPMATQILKVSVSALTKEHIEQLNRLLEPQGYQLWMVRSRIMNFVDLKKRTL